MKNLLIAEILYKIADLLEIQEVDFKPRAYRKAALNIEAMNEPIEDYYKQGKLKEIPGVGEGISKKIEEIIKTGTCREYEKLKKQVPVDFESLMKIEGLGPRKIKLLYQKLKIKSIQDLEEAIQEHKLSRLEGFGEKTELNLQQSLGFFRKSKGRFLLSEILPIAEDIKDYLKKKSSRVEIAGSLRRFKETIGDVDILAIGEKELIDYFTKYKNAKKILAKGSNKSSVLLDNGLQVDLRLIPRKSFGAALQYFTGNKEHNIHLRILAQKKGLKLSEYGLFRGNRIIAGRTEEEVYKKLGLHYIEPELREDSGEIEAAKNLPILIQLNDIKGDLHTHTKYSDGNDTIEEMAKQAINLGYEYIAITDHYGSLKIANAMNSSRIKKQWKEIDTLNKKTPEKYLKRKYKKK